jgi:RNA polymerase sigma-54 factor
MALTTKLELRQGQTLVMTPQLQQAIKLLQLSNLELNDFVEAEIERNPLLERESAEGEPAAGDGESAAGVSEPDGLASLEHGDGDEDWHGTGRPDEGAGARPLATATPTTRSSSPASARSPTISKSSSPAASPMRPRA